MPCWWVYWPNGKLFDLAMGGSGPKHNVPTLVFTASTTYDGIQRPLSTSVTRAGTTLWRQTRIYDSIGNVLGLSTVVPLQKTRSFDGVVLWTILSLIRLFPTHSIRQLKKAI
jgi:hypothetical protein